MPDQKSGFRSFLELVGSVRLGVVLLVLLAACSVLGTVILQSTLPGGDAAAIARHYGDGACRILKTLGLTDVFHAPWYHALLGLVALNILCSTVANFSLRPTRWGFLLAHAGVLLVLLGGFVYFTCGDKGVISLGEGETAHRYVSRRSRAYKPLPFSVRLDRFNIDYYPAEMVFFGPGNQTLTVRPREGGEVKLPWDDTCVQFERVIGNARRVTEVGQPPEDVARSQRALNPAARFLVETPEGPVTFWRFARRKKPADTLLESDGRIAVAFDGEKTEKRRPLSLPVEPTLLVLNRNTETSTAVRARAGKTFKLPDVKPPATGQIIHVLDDADNTTLGPGLRIQINAGGAIEWRHVFARLPAFNPDAFAGGRPGFPEIRFVYYRPRTVLHVVHKGGDAYEMHWWTAGTWRKRPIALGTPVEVAEVKLTLLGQLPDAWVETRYDVSEEPTGIEAVKFRLTPVAQESSRAEVLHKALSRSHWISTEDGETRVECVSFSTFVATDVQEVGSCEPLLIRYAPSRHVREYRSELTLTNGTGKSRQAAVRVNHPASYRDWQVFQQGYFPVGARLGSVLTVSRDPGLPMVYAGLMMLTAGVFYASFVKPVLVRRKGKR